MYVVLCQGGEDRDRDKEREYVGPDCALLHVVALFALFARQEGCVVLC